MADVTMPQLGETVTEGTITRWFKQPGEHVALDEVLFEVSTDKVDSEVPSPVEGTLTAIVVAEGETVDVGVVLATIGDAAAAPDAATESAQAPEAAAPPAPAAPVADVSPAPAAAAAPAPPAPVAPVAAAATPTPPVAEPTVSSVEPVSAGGESTPESGTFRTEVAASSAGMLLSPVVRRLITRNSLDVASITGTGVGGRITRADVEAAISQQRQGATGAAETTHVDAADPNAVAPVGAAVATGVAAAGVASVAVGTGSNAGSAADTSAGAPPASAPAVDAPPQASAPVADPAPVPAERVTGAAERVVAVVAPLPVGQRDEVVPLNRIRRMTADYMVQSKQVSPHVLTAVEVDFENVERSRKAHRAEFKEQEGFSLTYLPFISRALVDALRDFPHMNASMGEHELIVHGAVNLAIAVDLNFEGLLAPVVKGADGKRLRTIARDTVDLAARARAKQLTADEITGGTFTITNAGQYGTMMQFPIINQPQVAILSTDGIRRKPVVITDNFGNETVGIHSVGVLALAWDHRAFDGAYAAAFLDRLRTIIETRDWEAELE